MATTVRTGDIVAKTYRVERVLGTGGMGVVVAARHTESGALRAVKIMNREPAEAEGWAARFRREALVGQRLKSEHAVRVHEAGGFEEGRPWLVMEHLEGTDLGKLLRKRGPLPIVEAAGYVADACEAIAEAHDIGVVHRDLKPANLFLATRADGTSCVKVLDFGISKVSFGEDPEALAVTQSGEVIGSPAYMAPEQIRSFGKVDPRSDVWALGVILYELLTGKWPFPGKASVEMIAMVLERKPDPATKHRADLPAPLEVILTQCLEKDLDRRLGSARALQKALAPFLPVDDEESEDRPTPVAPHRASVPAPEPEPEGRPPAPEPVSVPAASTASQAVERTLPIEPDAGGAPPRRRVVLLGAAALGVVAVVGLAMMARSPASSSSEGRGDERAATSAAPSAAGTSGGPPEPTAQGAPGTAGPPVNGAAPAGTGGPSDSAAPAGTGGPSDSAEPAGTPADGASDAGASEAAGAGAGDAGSDGVWRPWNRPGGKPLVDAPRAGDGRTVDPLAASAALRNAALTASKRCKKPGGPTGAARVDVSFAPSGQAASVRIGGPFDGTPVGKCIVGIFRGATMPAFQGSSFTASKTITIK